MDDGGRLGDNRRHWDEAARLHATTYFVDGEPGFDGRLTPFEVAELGDVAGLRICHLQCHLGGEALAFAAMGATVVGVDFSSAAIEIARDRARAEGVDDRVAFVCADVVDAADAVDGTFDGVYVSWGAVCWLPDLAGWAAAIRRLLAPGGWCYVADTHPQAMAVRVPGYGYGGSAPFRSSGPGDYTDRAAEFAHDVTWEWNHGIGEVVSALAGAGLAVDWLHEHPAVAWNLGDDRLVRRDDGLWELPGSTVPLSFSIRAHRPDPASSTAAIALVRAGLDEGMDAHLAPFFHTWLDTFVFHGRLDPRLRELAILRIMWRCGQAFEWGNHYRFARDAGVTRAQVLAIRTPTPERDLDGAVAVVVRAADEVVDDGVVGEATMGALGELFPGPLLDELLYLLGGYRMYATVSASKREGRPSPRAPWPPDGVGP